MPTVIDFGKGAVTFFNATPHSINIIEGAEYKAAIRKWIGGREIAVIPTDTMLSAQLDMVPIADLGNGVTICEQQALSCDPLPPDAKAADYIVVSAIYGIAYQMLHGLNSKLVSVRDLVVDSETYAPVGCRGLATIYIK